MPGPGEGAQQLHVVVACGAVGLLQVGRGQGDARGVDALRELVRERLDGGTVLLGRAQHRAHDLAQIDVDEVRVHEFAHLGRGLGVDDVEAHGSRMHPVAHVVQRVATHGDRLSLGAFAPHVDRVGKCVDGPSVVVSAQQHGKVLEQHVGELIAAGLPEATAPHLVPHHAITHEQRNLTDRRALTEGGARLDVREGLLDRAGQRKAPHLRAGEVGAGLLQRGEQLLERARGEQVVAVDEHEELTAHLTEGGVARRPGPNIRLTDEAETSVGVHPPLRDRTRAVGRAVIDEDALERRIGLGGDGCEALVEELADVEERNDRADERRHSTP